MSMIDYALEYVNEGFKVFPVKPDKTPLTSHGLKDATQTITGVKDYWTKFPEAGIGVVTDGFIVIDFDVKNKGLESRQAIDEKYGLPQTRIHLTGGGGFHYIYKNPNGRKIGNTVSFGGYPGVDIRADGGYIVAPPSPHTSGNNYQVYDYSPIIPAPDWVLQLLNARKVTAVSNTDTDAPIPSGQRNATLASLAGTMRRRGMGESAIAAALLAENVSRCQPPLDETEVLNIAKSVKRYSPVINDEPDLTKDEPPISNDNDGIKSIYHNSPVTEPANTKRDKSVTKSVTKSLSDKIEEWVSETNSWFSYEDCDKDLGIRDIKEKDNRRQIFKRLKDAGKIESHPKNNKLYRYVNTSVRLIDFKTENLKKPVDIKYPFGIEEYFNTYPGNIIVVAGSPDAGKTAFLLNFIKMNQYDFSIYYQSSEMGVSELQNRLMNFDGIGLQDWNFQAEERSSDFADVIRPDCVNIIDYLELCGDFYMIAEYLKQIHDKLKDGIAIVALQKDPKATQGRGGTFGLEKPRLYLNMDAGQIFIRKAKNWTRPDQNPNGLKLKYKIVGGCKFIVTEDWHKEEDEPAI